MGPAGAPEHDALRLDLGGNGRQGEVGEQEAAVGLEPRHGPIGRAGIGGCYRGVRFLPVAPRHCTILTSYSSWTGLRIVFTTGERLTARYAISSRSAPSASHRTKIATRIC